jgi:hypothetical protein
MGVVFQPTQHLQPKLQLYMPESSAVSADYRSGHFATNIGLNFSSNLKDLMVAIREQVGIKRFWA